MKEGDTIFSMRLLQSANAGLQRVLNPQKKATQPEIPKILLNRKDFGHPMPRTGLAISISACKLRPLHSLYLIKRLLHTAYHWMAIAGRCISMQIHPIIATICIVYGALCLTSVTILLCCLHLSKINDSQFSEGING
jgi:hypothetical protein